MIKENTRESCSSEYFLPSNSHMGEIEKSDQDNQNNVVGIENRSESEVVFDDRIEGGD